MNKKIKVVVVSKDQSFKIQKDQIQDIGYPIDCMLIADNKKPLAEVYNNILEDVRNEGSEKYDFVMFMHADVSLDFKHLIEHLYSCKGRYDVIGLCGTSIMNISQCPLNWWTGSNPTPEAKWGCVTHGELGNQKSYFSKHSPEVKDHEVACIDGLCIIFGDKALSSDMKFDEQFQFDLYDTDISFQTIMKYNLCLGVLVEESLQHYSIGRSILTDDFLRHEHAFRVKWGLDIPDKILKVLDTDSQSDKV